MSSKTVHIELPEDLYRIIGRIASERFKTETDYIKEIIFNSVRNETELKEIKRNIAYKYASGLISYESLKSLLGAAEAERIRIYKEAIMESFDEAGKVAKRLKN